MIKDILEVTDEMVKGTSEYWGNLMGYKKIDLVEDEFMANDKKDENYAQVI